MLLRFELVSNNAPFLTNLKCSGTWEGFQKQKMKFKIEFAMKGVGGGSRVPLKYLKNDLKPAVLLGIKI